MSMSKLAAIVPAALAQKTRSQLEQLSLYDDSRCVGRDAHVPPGSLAIPVLGRSDDLPCVVWRDVELPISKKVRAAAQPPIELLKEKIIQLAKTLQLPVSETVLLQECPKKYDVHTDMVVLPEGSFTGGHWDSVVEGRTRLWTAVASVLKCQRLAVKGAIANTGTRDSQTRLVLGHDVWARHVEDGVIYEFNIERCMFSTGNVTERTRVSYLAKPNEVIVDLYCGIGYFTLPFLVRAKAAHVYACDWNPFALEALKRNLNANRIEEGRCTMQLGDNAITSPVGVADRVHLGLIPTSEASWPTAARCLKASGGFMHVHGNVSWGLDAQGKDGRKSSALVRQEACSEWAQLVVAHSMKHLLSDLHQHPWTVTVLHVEQVKSYAPHLEHCVADIECRPQAVSF